MTQGSALGDYLEQQGRNPAAPAGAQQMARQAGGGQSTKLAQYLIDEQGGPAEPGYTGGAQSWLTGANQEGTNSGWDNSFVDTFTKQWSQALEEGTAREYFARDDATGVVTWDHEVGGRKFHFGDVYEDGRRTGNLFEDYDRDDANLMMAPWILDAETQAETASDSDRLGRLDREIQNQREQRNSNFEDSLKALEFEGDVEKREEFFREGIVDEALIAGGSVLGGALAGGAAAAVTGAPTGPGALLAAAGGALAGGVGAYLNKDSLTEQAARAYEITSMSYEQNGLDAMISTGLHQFSGVAGRLLMPTSNLTQGIYDAVKGDVGDGDSEFYRTDEEGKNTTPRLVRALDLTSTVADSMLQFTNPVGVALFTTQMGGMVGGQVAELVTTGGETFDYRQADFDNIFTDDDGNIDWSAGAAGVMKVGIDAVQLGMARGLAGRANALRSDVGQDAAYGSLVQRFSDKVPTWMGGSRGLQAGEQRVRAAGFSMTRNAQGEIVQGSMRPTLGLLAPSEQIAALEARVLARRNMARNQGAATADDFYRAATSLATGERRLTTALVNGFGEAYEEGVQAVLEPHSHGASIDGYEILENALYGAAAGTGMSLGTQLRTPTAGDRMFAQAQLGYTMMTGGAQLSRADYDSLTEVEQRRMAALSESGRAVAESAYKRLAEEQAANRVAGVVGEHKVVDAVQTELAKNLSRATDRTDGAFVITGFESAPITDTSGRLAFGEIPNHAVVASADQTLANLMNHARGLTIQHTRIRQELETAIERAAADPADETLQAEVARRQAQLARIEVTVEMSQELDRHLDRYAERINAIKQDYGTTAEALPLLEAEVAELNAILRAAFSMSLDSLGTEPLTEEQKQGLARAVSLVFVRDPQDQAGSYQVLVPQVSAELTEADADHVLQVSRAILPAISGDYDGDKIRQQAQLVLDDEAFLAARTGLNYLGAGPSVTIEAPKAERFIVDKMADALAGETTALRTFARETLNTIGRGIKDRYAGRVDAVELDEVLGRFYEAVEANDKDARKVLLDGLLEIGGADITGFGRENMSNEWLWIDQFVVSMLQRFQEAYAANRPRYADPSTATTQPVAQQPPSDRVRRRREENHATLGQSLASQIPGDSLFRKFQDLHYTSIGAEVLSAEGREGTSLEQMALLYRQLGQAATGTALENIRAKDNISRRVLAQIEVLVADLLRNHPELNLSPAQARVVVANLSVADITIDTDGAVSSSGKQITLAQMLLKQAVAEDRRANDRVWDASPELQAKHARLLGMTRPGTDGKGAERAFVEVFGAQQMYTLLGEEAAPFGPHLTLEQYLRDYVNLDEVSRSDRSYQLRVEPGYVGRTDKPKSMPYLIEDVAAGNVSAYRSVVDALLAVGNSRISIDRATGKLSGEIAERSERVSTDFEAAFNEMQQALAEFRRLSPRDGESTADAIARMMEASPDTARAMMDLVPNAAAAVAFRRHDGQWLMADWVYEAFAQPNAKAAEMYYWRNLTLAQWRAKGMASAIEEEGEENHHARTFDRLDRRIHRIMYRLAALKDGGILYSQFIQKLSEATDLDSFLLWVNTHPGIRGRQAPLTAWVDDVAEFDPDKSGGGWTSILPGSELRESIGTLRSRTRALVTSIKEEQAAAQADHLTRAAIRRVIKRDAGDTSITLDAGDRALYNKFAAAIRQAGEWFIGAGPQAMVNQTVGAVQGFQAKSHTKGLNPANVSPVGQMDMVVDAYDYVTGYERMLSSLTAVNLDAVGQNLHQAMKDGVRTMDDSGRPIDWTPPTPEQMLDLLDDPDTRPLARGLLFPQVMERDANNVMRPAFLVGKSLTDLLRGTSYAEMFPHNGKLSRASAFKYLSWIEGLSRKHGGHAAVQRAVNDIVIARTSAADHVLSEAELESMTVTAYYEVAQVLQQIGSLAAQQREPGVSALDEMRQAVTDEQRKQRLARALGMDVAESEEITDLVLDSFVDAKQEQFDVDLAGLAARLDAEPDKARDIQAQIDALRADRDRFVTQVEILRSDDAVGHIVEMFSVDGSTADQAAGKTALATYVLDHPSMLHQVPAARPTLAKFFDHIQDPARDGQPNLTPAEWEELSRAVIGHFLERNISESRSGATISPWPNADRPQDQRYFDSSWHYLATDMLRPDHPLALAARDAHLAAGRYGSSEVTAAEFTSLLNRTILDTSRLGPWTGDIPRASIEANSRLDSAAAAQAIAAAGNSPKRQAAVMAAMRRTYAVPDASLLSTATLSWHDLARDDFDEVDVVFPDGVARPRPLVQLSNRFARSVTMTITNEQGAEETIDLLPGAMMSFPGNAEVDASGYAEVTMARVRRVAERKARERGLDPTGAVITMEFFHPDSQPQTESSGTNWYNNVFFEGTSFAHGNDSYESLAASLWFSPGGINQTEQRKALDASKTGKPALERIETATSEQRAQLEADALTDLGAVLRAKAREVMRKTGLEANFFNAVYKDLKIRHFVRGTTAEGAQDLWTAEEVIRFQTDNPGQPLPFQDAELYIPTDDVLRSMLGELGTQGVTEIVDDRLEIDLARIPTYRGVSANTRTRFDRGLAGEKSELAQTRLTARSRQTLLTVRPMLDQATRSAFDAKMRYLREREQTIHLDRGEARDFNAAGNLGHAVRRAEQMLTTETLELAWAAMGLPIGPRDRNSTLMSQQLLQNLHAAMQEEGNRTGWIYREGAKSQPQQGLISEVALSGKVREAYRVAPNDLVVVELDSFNDDRDLALQRLEYMADKGAVIVLAAADGSTDMRAEMAEYLLSDLGYEKINGSDHAYRLSDLGVTQNERARSSTLWATEPITTRSRVAVLNVEGQQIEEGTALVNKDNERLGSIAVIGDLVPSGAFRGFNVPASPDQIEAVRTHLFGLDSPEFVRHLTEMANGDEAVADDWRKLIDRLGSTPGEVLPRPGETFGIGDMIPLVDNRGRVLLYRHGYKAPRRDQIEEMAARRPDGSLDSMNVAVYPGKREDAATVHDGEVVEFRTRAGYGLEVELLVPLQAFGDKKQLEFNGMKYVLAPMRGRYVLPEHGFFPNWGIDMISDIDTLLGKEAVADMVDNHRNAFAFFGIDFTDDVARFFFPGQQITGTHRAYARELLHAVATRAPRIKHREAEELLQAHRIDQILSERLPASIRDGVQGIPDGWVNRLSDLDSVENRITSAILIYLMTPGARVEDVLKSGGFNNDTADPEMQSRLMPRVFTQVFDDAPIGSPLRTEINRRFNLQLHNPLTDGTGYVLREDFKFEVRNGTQSTERVEVTADDILAYYQPGDLTDEVHRGMTAEQMWAYKLEQAKASGMYDAIKAEGSIQPITLTHPSDVAAGHTPKIEDGHHRIAVARDLGIPIRWRYQGDAWDVRHTGAPEGVTAAPKSIGAPEKNLSGWLSFPEAHSSGDNPVKNGMAFDDTATAPVSYHSAALAYGAAGADTAYAHDITKARIFLEETQADTDFERDLLDGGVWRMLNDIPDHDLTYRPWDMPTPGQAMRLDLAREAMIQFRQPIIKDEDHNWSTKEKADYEERTRALVVRLGLQEAQAELVDFWVRQTLGQPAGFDKDNNDLGRVTGRGALSALEEIELNVQDGFMPTAAAEVPMMHLHDLQLIYRANRNKPNGWKPRESVDSRTRTVETWDDWTKVSLGTALTSDNLFDPLYLLALDGFVHTYQHATPELTDLPVSVDALVDAQLADPNLNQMIVSISDPVNVLASEPLVIESARATLEQLMGGQRIAGKFHGKAAPVSEVAKRRAARRKWRKENGVPIPVDVTMKNFRKNGADFVNEGTNTSGLIRMAINMRLGMALINPALYVSMGPEQWIRASLDRVANLLTGQDTGRLGAAQAQLSERLEGTRLGRAAEAVGLNTRYTPEQISTLSNLYRTMGQRHDFKALIYRDLRFEQPHTPGSSKIERGTEKFARLGLAMQDPTYGMKATTMARRYLEAALQYLQHAPTRDIVSVEMLAANLQTDPTWLSKNHPEAHQAAVNAVAQIRSMKETVLGATLKGIYEPASQSSNTAVNVFGNLLLKIPMIFSNYATNVTTTILGLQGLDQMTAALIDGRKKGPRSLFGRMQAAIRGEEFTAEDDARFDMSSVLEGIDLSRAFIRGGLTHTGLLAFGMWAGSLGLSGEDEEMRRKRLLAQNQGLGVVYDPRRPENDFRNADAIYLDALPFGIGNLFDVDEESGRAMANPHWMVRQFLSPVVGIENFLRTGDTRQITWGFMDAIGAFPLVNETMWKDAVETSQTLFNEAETAERNGDSLASMGFLMRGVWTYERMLFESSFINSLYIGMDKWDRDPYTLPLRDSDGELQSDIEGNTRPQNLALASFIDPETGQIREGFLGRDQGSATRHSIAENRGTFAFISSLFTGGLDDSDFWRYNMPIKTREIEKAPIDQEEATANLLGAAGAAAAGQPILTMDEVLPSVRQRLYDLGDRTGQFFTDADVRGAAEEFIRLQTQGRNNVRLTYVNQAGVEELNDDGKAAVVHGLFKGTLDLDSPEMRKFYLSFEDRKAIQDQWAKETVAEGLAFGLDKSQAIKRMERLLNGYGEDGAPGFTGFRDILWSDKISYNNKQIYGQLNTTYVIGPDGRPWATGFKRTDLLGALGLRPFERQLGPGGDGTRLDERYNTVDLVNSMNTGLRGLVPFDDSRNVPTDVEIGESIEEAIKEAAQASYAPFEPFKKGSSGGGWGGWGRWGGRGGGGGGGGGSAYFDKMYSLPKNISPYGNSMPFINTSNPIIRRGYVRRERVWSERGRLKQWQ